jgi:hypothetical protein
MTLVETRLTDELLRGKRVSHLARDFKLYQIDFFHGQERRGFMYLETPRRMICAL